MSGPTQVGATWGRLCQWAGMRGLFGPDTQCFGVCYDDPEITPPDKIRYDACLTVNRPVEAEGDVGVPRTRRRSLRRCDAPWARTKDLPTPTRR